MSNADKELEDALGKLITSVGKGIYTLLKGIFRGIKKLIKLNYFIGFLISVIIAGIAYVLKSLIMGLDVPIYIRWTILIVLMVIPALYLFIIGNDGSQSKYDKIFSDIAFIGKDNKYPYFCGKYKDGKKLILVFKSNITLETWKSKKGDLETALDYSILKMEAGSSKKVVKLTVLPSDFKIPDKITWQDTLCSIKSGTLSVGSSALDTITFDLNKVPHVLCAGETGSGKSVILRCMLWQMILQNAKVYMIDFKGGVEFGVEYEKYGTVITEREQVIEVLDMLVKENECRLKLFRELRVKNLEEYNRKTKQNLCRIGLFSDEIAQMLDKKGVSKEDRKIFEAIEGRISTLARLSRATGINLFLGVQRPDANVLTGQIKNNIPVRICGRFADKTASEIVLGNTDACDLPDIKGRFLYKVGNETIEFQAFFFDDETMLHDITVHQGDMLIEKGKRKYKERNNDSYEGTLPIEEPEIPEDNPYPEMEYDGDIPEEYITDKQLKPDDLNLNYGEE